AVAGRQDPAAARRRRGAPASRGFGQRRRRPHRPPPAAERRGMNASPLTIHIPLRLRRHGGRKLVIVPDGSSEPAQRRPDDALVKALARAWRWKRMIESGKVRSLGDIAES